jgi:hypothetical protein
MWNNVHLARPGVSRQFTTFDPQTRVKTVHLAPGAKVTLVDHQGTGLITRLWFTCDGWFWRHWEPKQSVEPTILKTLILRMYWDGNEYPSVEAPLGDFFGIGHCEYRHFSSLFLGMSSGGFYSYFPMPFSRGVRLEIENLHETASSDVFMNINYQELESLEEGSGRFHCAFNCGENSGSEPMTILNAHNRGHYVGCCLSMQGQDLNYLSFLEAPEYIWVDTAFDEAPSLVGTGLEDYFNGGWYFRDGEFYGSYHGVPLKDTLRSMVSMYRFHAADAITFEKSIEVAFVNPWDAERLQPFRFSSTAYWYGQSAQPLFQPLPPPQNLIDLYRIRDVDHQSIP